MLIHRKEANDEDDNIDKSLSSGSDDVEDVTNNSYHDWQPLWMQEAQKNASPAHQSPLMTLLHRRPLILFHRVAIRQELKEYFRATSA